MPTISHSYLRAQNCKGIILVDLKTLRAVWASETEGYHRDEIDGPLLSLAVMMEQTRV
jgi:hypothetical protein